jgi:cyclophilin family peptidyl-prolyl cis-trans isomerase
MFSRLLVMSATALAVAALGACGGKAPELGPVLTGQFLDGPVEGLGFRTATLSGTTGAQGQFSYRAGESVTFFIGGLELPSVRGAAVVTPLEVAGTGSLNDARVVNMLVLLQSLDEDANASNGIKIPAAASTAAAGGAGQALGSALTTSSTSAFAASQGLRDVLDGAVGAQRAVAAAQPAVDHFAQTLSTSRPDLPFVSRVSVDGEPAFDAPVRLRFEGRNLDRTVLEASATGACVSMVADDTTSGDAVEYTCVPVTIGALNVTLKAGARTLNAYVAEVPAPAVAPQVRLDTSLGSMTIELDVANAPITSINFLRYVADRYYENTVFHRVISNFMVQGGGFEVSNNSLVPKGGTHPPIVLERTTVTGLSNTAGTIAMARTNVENSATSQFYINTVDNLFLNGTVNSAGYAVFGRVVAGVDTTLMALRGVPVQNNGSGEDSLPLNPPVILSATRVR